MASLYMYICQNCGYITDYTQEQIKTTKCICCGNTDYVCLDVNPVEFYKMSQGRIDALLSQKLGMPEWLVARKQIEWKKIREEIEREQSAQRLSQRNEQRRIENQNKPKCPTCGSTNVEKISTTKKAIGFVAVGVFSSNFGKTMHCKNCGYKW